MRDHRALAVALCAVALIACGIGPIGRAPTATPDRLRLGAIATARALSGVADPRPTPRPLTTATARPTALATQAVPATKPSPTPPIAFAPDRPLIYAAIGASDSTGVGATDPEREGWVVRLSQRLPAGSTLVNAAVAGARMRDALTRQLPRVLDASPDLVTVWMVVNDLNAATDLAEYERDFDLLLRDLTARTNARVMVANCPDLTRVPAYIEMGIPADLLRLETARWNELIAGVVQRYPGRVVLADAFNRSAEIEYAAGVLSTDDFHPSTQGHAIIAEMFWQFGVAHRLFAPA